MMTFDLTRHSKVSNRLNKFFVCIKIHRNCILCVLVCWNIQGAYNIPMSTWKGNKKTTNFIVQDFITFNSVF